MSNSTFYNCSYSWNPPTPKSWQPPILGPVFSLSKSFLYFYAKDYLRKFTCRTHVYTFLSFLAFIFHSRRCTTSTHLILCNVCTQPPDVYSTAVPVININYILDAYNANLSLHFAHYYNLRISTIYDDRESNIRWQKKNP